MSNDDSNDTPVICLLPPPELHRFIGPVNKMYTELEAVWPESEDLLKACNVKKEEYHGGSFAGNESRRLLRNVGRLEALPPTGLGQLSNRLMKLCRHAAGKISILIFPER